MVVRFGLWFALITLLTACAHHHNASFGALPPSYNAQNQQNRAVSSFRCIQIKGALNVQLRTSNSKPQVVLRGDPRDLANVITRVSNDTLHVTVKRGYPRFGAVDVAINTPRLQRFEYHGSGNIIGKQLYSSMLDLIIDNQGQTTLEGRLSIRRLEIDGKGMLTINGIQSPDLVLKISGQTKVKLGGVTQVTCLDIGDKSWLSLYWIRSKALIVRANGAAYAQLAGVVDKLDVELRGSARFNGRYLRAYRAFVKTHDQAVAEMSAVKHQHTLASDASDIHFYNLPTTKADFMAYEGAVLDMRDLSSPFIQEYTRYNK